MCRDLFHTHMDGEEAAFCVCRAHEELPPRTSAVPQPSGLSHLPQHRGQTQVPVSPRDRVRSSSPLLPGGAGTPPCPGRVRGARGSGSPVPPSAWGLHRRPPPGAAPGAGTPFPGACGGRGGGSSWPSRRRSPAPAHRSPISPSPAPQRGLPAPSPFSSPDQEFSHHPLAEECLPPPRSQIPGSRGSPAPPARPGCPSPAPGEAEFLLTPCLLL